MKTAFIISYKGTSYSGWQVQDRFPSVQKTLQNAIEGLLGRKVNLSGCTCLYLKLHLHGFNYNNSVICTYSCTLRYCSTKEYTCNRSLYRFSTCWRCRSGYRGWSRGWSRSYCSWSCHATDRTEIEASMLLAGIGDNL